MTTSLDDVLDDFDRWIRDGHPELYSRLRPGLTDVELERHAERLQPYHLPVELVALYRWHDGWELDAGGVYRYLLPSAHFNALAEGIDVYEGWLEALGFDGWHPLWFPAFGWQHGELVALQLEPGRPAGQVYSFHSETELSTSYDSIAAMFATGLDLWRHGLLPEGTAFPEIPRLAATHNPLSLTSAGVPRKEISRAATRDWPPDWKHVLGIGPLVPALPEDVVTIAELTADLACRRPIHAELRGVAGSGDTLFATASDETGRLTAFLLRGVTENFREAEGAGRFELWLEPFTDATDSGKIASELSVLTDVGSGLYFATRVVPL